MGAPAVRADGYWLDWGAERYDFRHKLGKGQNSATVDQTNAFTDFLNDIPAYSRAVVRGIDVLLLDSVDLSLIGKKSLVLDFGPTLVRKNPAGTGGLQNEGHLFKDRTGVSEGLVFLGGRFDLQRSNWIIPGSDPDPGVGDLVSAWFFQRCRDITFIDCKVFDGIEEGGKFYKCQDFTFIRPRIDNVRNNGLQFHSPLEASEGFQGDTGAVPNQGTERIKILGGHISRVDDGQFGVYDGQCVTFNHIDDSVPTKDIWVEGMLLEGGIRGIWVENNGTVPGENVTIHNNVLRRMMSFGIGVVGADGVTISENKCRNIGQEVSQSSERTAFVISGGATLKSKRITAYGNQAIDDRDPGAPLPADRPQMMYGWEIKQCEDSPDIRTGVVHGATVQPVRVDASSQNNGIFTTPVDRVELGVTSSQAISDGVEHTMEWDNEIIDTNDLHGMATQAERQVGYTVKIPGTIAHDIRVGVVGSKAGRLRLYRRRGAVLTLIEQASGPAITDPTSEETTYSIKGENSDYEIGDELLVYFTAWVRSGATLAMASAGYQTYFKARHVGG